MFLEKIKIKNFKSFSDEVVLDLNCNSRVSEEDVNLNKFYKNGDIVLPRVVSITGANSIGKTSILDAIDSLRLLLQPLNIEFFDFEKCSNHDKERFMKNIFMMNLFQKVNNQLEDPITINNFNIYNYDTLYSKVKDAVESDANINFDISSNELKDLIILLGNSAKERWHTYKHYKNIETIIEYYFYDDKLNEEAQLLVSDKNDVFNIDIKCKSEEMKNKVKKLHECIYYHNWDFETLSNNGNGLQQYFIILINEIQKLFKLKDSIEACNKLVTLLGFVDQNIEQIILNNNNNLNDGIKFISIIDGSNVSINQLSTGTKKFIKLLVPFLVMFNSNTSGIILVDEIDNYLHQDIVDFFKRIIYTSESTFQLFFTTHNYYVATNLMSHKQVYYIEDFEGDKTIRKVSKLLNPTKDPIRAFNSHIIGSHPFQSDVFNAIVDISKHIPKK